MVTFYKLNTISNIMDEFKVKNIVVLGLPDENLLKLITDYDAKSTEINLNIINNNDTNLENRMKRLSEFNEYDAVFINDDANYYTLFSELNTIKNSNKEFPLIFICNNKFPNKRRDSYSCPNSIPQEFINNYSDELTITHNNKKIIIKDGFFHAIDENTSKNGVLTAIEDFIFENNALSILKIYFIEEITILYSKEQINKKNIKNIFKSIDEYKINSKELINELNENKLISKYFEEKTTQITTNSNLENEISKEEIIEEYENKLEDVNNELINKINQINNIESQISLKDSKIQNIETKLLNKESNIDIIKKELNDQTSNLNSLNQELENFKNNEANYKQQISILKQQHENELNTQQQKINEIKQQHENELNTQQQKINEIKQQSISQMSKIDNKEYCITCFKEEISNNKIEINYLKNNIMIKKIFSPIAYLYLILKSKPQELSLNLKLYRAIKDSECFSIGFYLNNNPDLKESKWCKYFSPELHYICNGFDEDRIFNKKYFNRHSKTELLDYILTCKNNIK